MQLTNTHEYDVAPGLGPKMLTRGKDAFFALPMPVQWVVISLSKSITASALMSFLAIYATAIFAVRHGFRVPVEGVPFLQFAIALATFLTFAATLVLFSVMMLLFRYIKMESNRYLGYLLGIEKTANKFSAKAAILYTKLILFIVTIISAFFSSKLMLAASGTCLLLSVSILLDTKVAVLLLPLGGVKEPSELALLLGGYSVLFASIWCVANNFNWIAAQILASILIFTVMAFGLFANDVYGSFLRVIRYGGGIAGTVKYTEGVESKTATTATGNLLIVTTTHAILFQAERKEVVEVPLKNIIAVQYDLHPIWQLPDYKLHRQRDFFDLEMLRESAGQSSSRK
jgi:hypothetical protein